MPGCCGNSTPDNVVWTVTYTLNGEKITEDVIGEQNARVAIIRAGNGTMRRKS